MDLLKNAVSQAASAVDKYVPPAAKTQLKTYMDKAKAYVNNASELEMKVLEATNHEPWGPHGQLMAEISQAAFDPEGFFQIMGVVDQRLTEPPENWRLIYKTLLLLEYMCKRGPLRVVEVLQSRRIPSLERLRDRFDFKEPTGKDQGINVRQRAGELLVLITDSRRLDEEREKANKNAGKYTGVASAGSSSGRYGGFAGGTAAAGYGGGAGAGSGGTGGNYSGYGNGSSAASSGSYGHAATSGAASAATNGSGGTYGGSAGGLAASTQPATSTPTWQPEGFGTESDADAVEATRRRIARLKAEGALPDGGSGGGGGGGGGASSSHAAGHPGDPPRLFDDEGAGNRAPKKLSDVKVNPAITAAFAKGGFMPPPRAGGAPAAAAAAPRAADPLDLLADLDVPPPAAAAPAAAASSDWDAFSGAAAPAAAPAAVASSDAWSSFSAAPAQPASGGLDLFGGSASALPDDMFSAAPAAAVWPAAAPAAKPAAVDPMALFGAPTAAPAAADPFAASFAPAPAAPKAPAAPAVPKLGPESERAAAKAKDPFADLLG